MLLLFVAILEDEDIAGIMSSENGKEIYESYRDRVDKLKESSSPQNMGIIIKVVSEITDKVGEFFLMQTANDGTLSKLLDCSTMTMRLSISALFVFLVDG